ncbi:hypothetical protein ES707_14620 [subsurface metagenome]
MNWLKWLLKLYPNLVASISEPLRVELVRFAKDFKVKAAKTLNPWDDFAAEVLCFVLGLDGEDSSTT